MKNIISLIFIMKKIVLFTLIFLVACSTPQLTITPELTIALQPTLTPTPTFLYLTPTLTSIHTISPRPTLNQTQITKQELIKSTQSVFQTEVAKFPRSCPNHEPYFSDRNESFSPDGLWLWEICASSKYHDLVLTFSNKRTHVLWRMLYHDYISPTAEFADGVIHLTHWSNNSQYAYFYTTLGGDGGYCFYQGYDRGAGVFRLDLQTGQTKEILPLQDNTWYGFSFSPTDRRLVYGIWALNLIILDIKTGKSINVVHKTNFSEGGGYVWSADGLEIVYSTVKSHPDNIDKEYTLRLIDAKTGVERILLESKSNCYLVEKWENNNILLIEYTDKNYNRAMMKYDLNLNIIIDTSATPNP